MGNSQNLGNHHQISHLAPQLMPLVGRFVFPCSVGHGGLVHEASWSKGNMLRCGSSACVCATRLAAHTANAKHHLNSSVSELGLYLHFSGRIARSIVGLLAKFSSTTYSTRNR